MLCLDLVLRSSDAGHTEPSKRYLNLHVFDAAPVVAFATPMDLDRPKLEHWESPQRSRNVCTRLSSRMFVSYGESLALQASGKRLGRLKLLLL